MTPNKSATTLSPTQPLDLKPIEQALSAEQSRTFQLAIELGMQLGAIKQTLILDKQSLGSGGKTIESEIAQLKIAHSAEYQVLSDNHFAIRQGIYERIKKIVQKVESYRAGGAEVCTYSSDMNRFAPLLKITEVKGEKCVYPAYPTDAPLPDPIELNEETALSVPITGSLMVGYQNEVKNLKQEVRTLRKDNALFLKRKEGMITSHQKLLEDTKKNEKVYWAEILLKVKEVYQKINWGNLVVSNYAYWRRSFSASSASIYHNENQAMMNIWVKKMQDRMCALIQSIEKNV